MTNNVLKKTLSFIIILFLFFAQFTNIPFVNPVVAGKNVSVYLGYIVVLISLVLLGNKTLKSISFDEVMLFLGIIFTVLVSIVSGNSFNGIWNEIYSFVIPLLIYYPIKYSGIKQKTLINSLLLTGFVGGVVSFLIATRVISVNKWAAANDLVRTAGFIDGTLGVVALCCAIILLSNYKAKYSRAMILIGLMGSAMIVLFGLSRLRIAMIIAMFFVILFINKPGRHSLIGKIRLLLVVCVLIGIVIYMFPNVIQTFLRMIETRFSRITVDDNTTYRIRESQIHIEKLISTMGFGTGWGVRAAMEDVFVHNMYTGVLMHCGIVFGLYYIFFLLKTTAKTYRNLKSSEDGFCENLLVFITMFVILLSGFGGAGVTQTGAWFGMAIVFSREDKI